MIKNVLHWSVLSVFIFYGSVVDMASQNTEGQQSEAMTDRQYVTSSAPTENLLQDINSISVGLVLPFISDSKKQTARFIEYYEGFLLALETMKERGLSANVYVFDLGSETGTDKLNSLLDTYEMKYLDLILGGVSSEQVSIISDFSRRNNIKYVIPFPTKSEEVLNNEKVYQINSPYSILYSSVSKVFADLFRNAHIIYVKEDDEVIGDRSELLNSISSELLQSSGTVASSVSIKQNLEQELPLVLLPGRKNVIVPGSASSQMLGRVLTILKQVQNNDSEIEISLFGHTDWQAYNRYFESFARFDTYIYTPFFVEENDPQIQLFMNNYHKWYNNKSLINTYPKYGILGYDTGMAFLSALNKYGTNFERNPYSTAVSTLQTPFVFKKEGDSGGYLNTGFYLVHYGKDGDVEKIEYGR